MTSHYHHAHAAPMEIFNRYEFDGEVLISAPMESFNRYEFDGEVLIINAVVSRGSRYNNPNSGRNLDGGVLIINADHSRNGNLNSGRNFDGGSFIIDAFDLNFVGRRPETLVLDGRLDVPATRGASKEAISRSLGTTVCENSAADDVCAVCLDPYREKQRIGVLGCRHRFHEKCIGQWLQINNVCPLCKAVGINLKSSI